MYYCGECGRSCMAVENDRGRWESDCCEANVFQDRYLEVEVYEAYDDDEAADGLFGFGDDEDT